MSDRPRHRVNPFDPTDERTSDQSTQTAGGLTGGRGATPDDEIVARDRRSRGSAPRRYEEHARGSEASPPDRRQKR